MELTDQQCNDFHDKLMKLPGVESSPNAYFIIEGTDQYTYLKAMSDNGIVDDKNGMAAAKYLLGKGCAVVQSRPRSLTIDTSDLLKVLFWKPTNLQIVEHLKATKLILPRDDDTYAPGSSPYICDCIEMVAINGLDSEECMNIATYITTNIIQHRIKGMFSVKDWLIDVVGVRKHHITPAALQAYRHRWLDSLIEEFQSKGD